MKRNFKNMMLSCLIAFAPVLVQAQTVAGKIVDDAGNAMPYANIVTLSLPDSAFVSGTVSKEDGSFRLDAKGQGRVVRITSMGYKTLYRPLTADLGIINMQPDTRVLGEVVVKSQLPKMRLKNGAMITTVAGTILEKAGTAERLLDRVPNVTAKKGKVEVFGRGTPIIYVNGRQLRDQTELDRISSADVRNVEVITNPGARYAAETTSVIRITTKKAVGDGFGLKSETFAAVDENGNFSKTQSLLLKYRTGGFEVSGNMYGASERDSYERVPVQYAYLAQSWRQASTLKEKNNQTNLYGKLALSYMFNPENSVGVSFSCDRYPKDSYYGTMSTSVHKNDVLTETMSAVYDKPMPSTKLYGNAYYVGKAGQLGIDFNVDWYRIKSNTALHNLDHYTETGAAEQINDVHTRTNARSSLGAAKLVLTYPVLGGDLGFGGEYSETHRKSIYTALPEGLIDNDDSKISEGLSAGFADYTRQIGPLSLQAGLRYEYVNFNYYEQGLRVPEQSRKYANWFPSVSLSMPVGKTEMQLSYATDIQRPAYYSLSSVTDYINRYTYQTGNPFLLPTIKHNLQYALSYKWIALQLMYTHVKNPSLFFGETYKDNPEQVVMKPVNGNSYDRAYAALSLQPTVGIWQPVLNFGLSRQWFSMPTHDGKRLDNPQATFRFDNNFSTKLCDISLMMTARTEGSNENTQQTRGFFNTDLMLSRSFLKDRLNIQLYVDNIFSSADQYARLYYGSLRSLAITEYSYTKLSLTVTYKLNATKSKYKGTGAGNSQRSRM